MSYKHTASAAHTLLRTTTAAQRLPQLHSTRPYSGTKLNGTEAVSIATGSSSDCTYSATPLSPLPSPILFPKAKLTKKAVSFPALAARVASLEAAHDFQVATSNAELSRSLRRPSSTRTPALRADAMDLFPRDLESSILKNLARAGHHETFDSSHPPPPPPLN
ncbi:hypothetical protein DFP73DRAFT_344901 [Morchella snyderi]|nr:hypothetical protein DFP73DRAFT_344901 [Morchella snyderi]